MYEQTVVLLARTTSFTVVCQTCAELDEYGDAAAYWLEAVATLDY